MNSYNSSVLELNEESIKKVFQNINLKENGMNSKINFYTNNYTISDIEECKEKLKIELNNIPGSNVLKNSEFLNKATDILIKNLMNRKENTIIENEGNKNNLTYSVFEKDYNKGSINNLMINNYDHIINIDTSFVSFDKKKLNTDNIYYNLKNNLTIDLSEKLEKIVELKLNTIQIPYTFYNITEKKNNNTFYIYKYDNTNNLLLNKKLELENGLYESVSDVVNELSIKISAIDPTLQISYSLITKKITFTNLNVTDKFIIHFYETNNSKFKENYCNLYNNELQTCLGWLLGSRKISETLNEYNETNVSEYFYSLEETIDGGESLTLDGVTILPNPKYFLFAIDDYSKNQHNKSLVQIDNSLKSIIPKKYPIDEKNNNMNCIDCVNENNKRFNNYTKAQKYSQIELLKEKELNKTKNKLNTNLNVEQILAIIPFNSANKDYETGQLITFKNDLFKKNNRIYFGPQTLERLKFTLYDNDGYIVDFNGNDWNFTLLATQLYNY